MSEGSMDSMPGREMTHQGDSVPPRLLLLLGVGAVLGTVGGYAVGMAVPAILINAVHIGFHAGWLGGVTAYLALTHRHAAESGRSRGECAAVGALLLGGIGFILGFYGPMEFEPEANQGPLLGIFFTGPAGACIGGAVGWLWHCLRTRRRI